MFGRKRLKQLEAEYQNDKEYLLKKIEHLEKMAEVRNERLWILEWKIENPPKMKVGDKPRSGIVVTDVYVSKKAVLGGDYDVHWVYHCIDTKTGQPLTYEPK